MNTFMPQSITAPVEHRKNGARAARSAAKPCIHRWHLASPDTASGGLVVGVCRKCDAERTFTAFGDFGGESWRVHQHYRRPDEIALADEVMQ